MLEQMFSDKIKKEAKDPLMNTYYQLTSDQQSELNKKQYIAELIVGKDITEEELIDILDKVDE